MDTLKAVFFDLGDTITDLGEGRGDYEARVRVRAGKVHDVLAAAGVTLPARDAFAGALAEGCEAYYQAGLAEQRGVDIEEALTAFFRGERLSIDDGLLDASIEAYCGGTSPGAALRSGALDVLRALQDSGLRLGVISNTLSPARYLDASLARRGILPFFSARIYSSEVGVAKPHPSIFRAALKALNVAPAEAVHVGDRLDADIAGAQAVGMRAVLVEVAGRPEVSAEIRPDARINELPELLQVLPRLFADFQRDETTSEGDSDASA